MRIATDKPRCVEPELPHTHTPGRSIPRSRTMSPRRWSHVRCALTAWYPSPVSRMTSLTVTSPHALRTHKEPKAVRMRMAVGFMMSSQSRTERAMLRALDRWTSIRQPQGRRSRAVGNLHTDAVDVCGLWRCAGSRAHRRYYQTCQVHGDAPSNEQGDGYRYFISLVHVSLPS